MGKEETIQYVAVQSGLSQAQVKRAIDAFIDDITIALQGDGRYAYPGFGVFTVKVRAARAGRNPATGAPVQIPAKSVVRFKPSPAFVEQTT